MLADEQIADRKATPSFLVLQCLEVRPAADDVTDGVWLPLCFTVVARYSQNSFSARVLVPSQPGLVQSRRMLSSSCQASLQN